MLANCAPAGGRPVGRQRCGPQLPGRAERVRVLDSTLAGDVVGVMLTPAGLAVDRAGSPAAGAGAPVARPRCAARRWLAGLLVLAMLACSAGVYLGLQPMMAAIREAAGPAGVRASPQWGTFAALHGVSQLFT
jgi:hypothetical protein